MNGRANAGKGSIAQNAGKERRERQRPQRVNSKLWHHNNNIKRVLKLAIEPHFFRLEITCNFSGRCVVASVLIGAQTWW